MNRAEFMGRMENLLQDISPSERADALRYYNDYFDDAGAENEQAVIEALGDPEKVAENIKGDIYGGCGDSAFQRTPASGREIVEYRAQDGGDVSRAMPSAEKRGMSGRGIALIVILCVLASPVLLGLAGLAVGVIAGILGVLVGFLATWFSLILAFGIMTVAFFAVLVVLTVVGAMCMAISPLTGIALVGAGMVCGGLSLLLLMLTVAMAGIVTPAIVRGIEKLFKKIFRKKEAAA